MKVVGLEKDYKKPRKRRTVKEFGGFNNAYGKHRKIDTTHKKTRTPQPLAPRKHVKTEVSHFE